MTELKQHQIIPTNWNEREKLRDKGQFWTPEWVAETMIEYVIKNSDLIFDPATGAGAFYQALKNNPDSDIVKFWGIDIDPKVLDNYIYQDHNCLIELRDFILNPPPNKFHSIIANPPYIRHHRLSEEIKIKVKEICRNIMGFTIDGRAGLHIYFLIQALNLLEKNGKLAFIMPSDTVEGIFAQKLWNWITNYFKLECVITFAPSATPFPKVDTNAIIFLIKNTKPCDQFIWVKANQAHTNDLKYFIKSEFKINQNSLDICQRTIKEGLKTGFSRAYLAQETFKYKLSDFATVMRGIATGANNFFYLTKNQAKELEISEEFLYPAIARTRDIEGNLITEETLINLDQKGRPTLLFAPDERDFKQFPETVQSYLKYGESLAINQKPLIKTRKPWYKMEKRKVPYFLFAYLGRRNLRFIKNQAKVIPLNGFLCIYPHSNHPDFLRELWQVLNDQTTIDNLSLVGKSYGAGAIKVEPRALANLPIANNLIEYNKYLYLETKQQKQLLLF
jgi:adenine-specific DNA-methyltransferase